MYIIATVSPQDLVVLFVVALVIFGPKRLPEVGRQVGHALRDLKKLSQEFSGALLGVQDQVQGSIAPLVSDVSGFVTGIAEHGTADKMQDGPVDGERDEHSAESHDLMASKTEFGEEMPHRSRRGVTMSTLPPESQGEA